MRPAHTLVANLKRSAERFPDRSALIHHTVVNYGELWRATQGFAQALLDHGFVAGSRVALVLENSAEYIAAYYGTLLAGGIVVPMNAAAKARDLQAWLTHCAPTWVVGMGANSELSIAMTAIDANTHAVYVDNLPGRAASKEHCFEEFAQTTHSQQALPTLVAETPACILYTSGTTGAPKGVLLSHANLASNCDAIVDYLQLTELDSIVCVLPFHYSYGSSVLHTHLQAGACIVLEPNLVYPHKVMQTLATIKATGFAGVPSTFSLLLSRVALADYDLSSLRYLTQAGGAMTIALTQQVRDAFPQARLFVMYGQTEATARISYLPPQSIEAKFGSVGLPLQGLQIEIRTEDGASCAPLQAGLVWVRGPNVMLGYWNNDGATQAVLQEGWLNTGDLGYLDADGFLFLQGRRSDMIKTGAHRVHPADVEEVIQQVSEVGEVAVVGIDDATLGEAIKACIVPATGSTVDPMKIKAHCREHLPTYKIPKLIEIRDALPKTASGKIIRHQLKTLS